MSVLARASTFGGTTSSHGKGGGTGDRKVAEDGDAAASSSAAHDVLLKLDDISKRPLAISCHSWNKDGSLLAFSPMNHEIHIVKYDNGVITPVDVLRAHDHKVTAIEWAPLTDRILSCAQDRNAYVWNREGDTWNPTLVLLQFSRSATFARWGNSEKKFAVASGSGTIAVCYYEEEHNWWISKIIEGFDSTVLTLAWHQSDCILAAGSSDCTVKLFSAACKGIDKKPPPLFGPEVNLGKLGVKIFEANVGSWVVDMSFSPDGQVLAYATHNSCMHFFTVLPAGRSESAPPSKENIQTLRMSGLPHRRLLFISNEKVVGAGHDSNPVLYTCKDGVWAELSKLDESNKTKRQSGGVSARNAAFRKFEMASAQGMEEGDSGNDTLPTRHQNCITGLSTCSTWTGPSGCSQFSSVGLDGRLCLWKLAA